MRRSEGNYPMRRDRGSEMMRPEWGMDPFAGFGTSPWQMMRRMQEDMDHLFGRFFGAEQGEPMAGAALAQAGGQTAAQWAPSLDVSSTDKEICLEADLPGVNKDDIDVTIRDHHLILKAEMRQEQREDQEERQYHRRERRYGFFERVIPLPENINEEQISCDFRNGVLTIHVPRTQQQQAGARRIQVMDAEQIPAETAGGRSRSRAEINMTEGDQEMQGQEMQGREMQEKETGATTRKKAA